ncbi:Transposase DDE domain protein [Pirellulimonas nuda]|uniref:Transposase DDE domain protein n=1 Tax=Pirellulimonas nuda TaxID=2528009 RepID=A0A518DAG8_9BACT|nr:IS5 family transposase [Pirellulimonas nuda]QDU88416.1 Transposase DDE domain protein [Pirellulimonas nuda]
MTQPASKPRKLAYKVTNWRDYNESLVRRGDITFWFDDAVIDAWEHENDRKKVGRPFLYSDVAVETLLMIRELFRLPYRQTEGFGRALAKLMQAEVAIPDYTSLQKRAAKLGVLIDLRATTGPIEVVVDSTGLKVYGEGEWKVKKHGVGKRRTWRKVHLAVDPATHTIVAQVVTGADTHDGDAVEPLLEQVEAEVQTFYGDGAYDQWKVRNYLQGESIHQVIPPRKNAKIKQHGNASAEPLERDECLRQIRRDGKKAWKESIGYHRRSLAETAMFRFKTNFGDRLKNRTLPNQATEVALRCKLLNVFITFGMPLFAWG